MIEAPDADSDAYWRTRPFDARIAALASDQSQPIASREALLAKVRAARERSGSEPPRPPRWGGYRVWADAIELWVGQPFRVHDRAVWTRIAGAGARRFHRQPLALDTTPTLRLFHAHRHPRPRMVRPALRHLSKADPVMRRLIRRVGPCTLVPQRRHPPYETLVRAIAHQQLNGRAAQTILERFIALFPGKRFPEPDDICRTSTAALRRAGFSRAKIRAIKHIAAQDGRRTGADAARGRPHER